MSQYKRIVKGTESTQGGRAELLIQSPANSGHRSVLPPSIAAACTAPSHSNGLSIQVGRRFVYAVNDHFRGF